MVGDEDRTDTAGLSDEAGLATDAPAEDAGSREDGPTEDGPVGPRPRGARLPWVVATVAVLIAVATVVVAALLIADARGPVAEIAEVEQAAGQFARDLTTWDASDGMADTREQLRAAGTDRFAADVDELFGGTDDLGTLEELGARSDGEVRDVLVQSIDGDEAVALTVVVQRVSTEITEGEEVSLRYALLTLRREGGDWRVDGVELVVDALQEAAERSDLTELPGFGDGSDEDQPTDEEAP